MTDSIRYGLLPLIARLLLAVEFVIAVRGKITGWSGQASYMAANHLPFIPLLLGAALAIELFGTIALITGFGARRAAAVLFVYLGIVSVELHPFWTQTGMLAGANMTHFFKNLGIMGGLLMVAVYGPGLWALGRRASASRTAGRSTVSGGEAPALT